MDKVSEGRIEKLAGDLKKLAVSMAPARMLWGGVKNLAKTVSKGYKRGTVRGEGGVRGGLAGAGQNVKGYFGLNKAPANMKQMDMFHRRRMTAGAMGAGAMGAGGFMAGRLSRRNEQ